jgi:hypothetical protein
MYVLARVHERCVARLLEQSLRLLVGETERLLYRLDFLLSRVTQGDPKHRLVVEFSERRWQVLHSPRLFFPEQEDGEHLPTFHRPWRFPVQCCPGERGRARGRTASTPRKCRKLAPSSSAWGCRATLRVLLTRTRSGRGRESSNVTRRVDFGLFMVEALGTTN